MLGLGAERRDPHRQAEVGRAAALEQEPQCQQVVVERLEDHARARDRPRNGRSPAPARPRGPRALRGAAERCRAVGEGPREERRGRRAPSRPGGSRPAAGGPAPVAIRRQRLLAGAGPGVGAEADASGLEEAKRGDQLAEGLDRAGAGVRRASVAVGGRRLADAGRGEEGRLPARGRRSPRRPAPPAGPRRCRRGRSSRWRARAARPASAARAAGRSTSISSSAISPPASSSAIALLEAPVVEREVGRARPQPAEEDDAGELGALARLARARRCRSSSRYGGRELGGLDRGARGAEGVEVAQRLGVIADEALGQRHVLRQRR